MVVKKAFSNKELKDVFKLRYQVYCIERGFEDPREYPHDLEVDMYDPYSIHFIAYAESHPVGTARLILNNPLGLPVEKHCGINVAALCDTKNVVEMSRYAVSNETMQLTSISRSRVTQALMKEVYQTGKELGIEYVFAAMSSGLERLLRRCGIKFEKAGDPVEYHGLRTPYFGLVKDLQHVFGRPQHSSEPSLSSLQAASALS